MRMYFEVLVFSYTVFGSFQLVLLSIQCLSIAYLDYVKERVLIYYRSNKNCVQIIHCLAKEEHTAGKVDVMKFLQTHAVLGVHTSWSCLLLHVQQLLVLWLLFNSVAGKKCRHVASHTRYFPCSQGTMVIPSGRFPSAQCNPQCSS